MTKRRTVLICAVAVLAAIYIIQLLFGLRSPQKRFKVKGTPDFISIENSGETITVQKNGEDWFCTNEKADSVKVEYLIEKTCDIKTLGVATRSANQNLLERYGLDKPIVVRATSGGKDLRTLLIGKETVTGLQVYVQIDGKNEIYLAQENLRRDFTFKASDLLPKEEETSQEPIEIEH